MAMTFWSSSAMAPPSSDPPGMDTLDRAAGLGVGDDANLRSATELFGPAPNRPGTTALTSGLVPHLLGLLGELVVAPVAGVGVQPGRQQQQPTLIVTKPQQSPLTPVAQFTVQPAPSRAAHIAREVVDVRPVLLAT